MDYFGVIKKAFQVTLKHKFLWLFGILAGGSAGASSFDFQMPSSDLQDSWNNFSSTNLNDFDWTTFWSHYGTVILVIITLFGILAIVLFILNLISQGALIGGVEKIEKDQKSDFSNSFMVGWHNFWRIWGLNITFLLAILIGLSIWIMPVCALVVIDAYIAAWIVGILLFFVNLAFWILIGLISPYALRIVVLKKHGIFESIRESLHLLRDHLGPVILMYLLLMAIGIAVGLAVLLTGLILIAILVGMGFGLYYLSPIAVIIYAILMGLGLLVLGLAFSGAYTTFTSSVLTLTYLKLIDRN